MAMFPKEMRFGHLISHTFPGTFLSFELILLIDLLSPFNILQKILDNVSNFSNLIAVLVILFVIGTTLGIVIDAIQHSIVETIQFIRAKVTHKKYEMYIIHVIRSPQSRQMFDEICENQLFYYYEAYANLAICFIPALYIVPQVLERLRLPTSIPTISFVIVLILILILVYEAIITYMQYRTVEREIVELNGKNLG